MLITSDWKLHIRWSLTASKVAKGFGDEYGLLLMYLVCNVDICYRLSPQYSAPFSSERPGWKHRWPRSVFFSHTQEVGTDGFERWEKNMFYLEILNHAPSVIFPWLLPEIGHLTSSGETTVRYSETSLWDLPKNLAKWKAVFKHPAKVVFEKSPAKVVLKIMQKWS